MPSNEYKIEKWNPVQVMHGLRIISRACTILPTSDLLNNSYWKKSFSTFIDNDSKVTAAKQE